MLSKSRYNRRMHRIKEQFLTLFHWFGERWKRDNEEQIYLIDTFPIAVCDNWRIRRCKLYQGEVHRDYISNKKRFYYGVKLHLMVAKDGHPVECFVTPASCSDVAYLGAFDFDLPPSTEVYADKTYNNYLLEDILHEAVIHFFPVREKNSKRKLSSWMVYWQKRHRKRVETVGSLIERICLKSIHLSQPLDSR